MCPLIQQLSHHPTLPEIERLLTGIPLIPIRHHQDPTRFQHPHQFLGKHGLIGHVRPCLNAPDHIKAIRLKR